METEEYQTQTIPGSPYFNQQASESSLRYQLENADILEDIEHSLKCEILGYDPATGKHIWYTPPGITPLLNEQGINTVLATLRSRLTKVFALTDLDEDEIRNITISVSNNIIQDVRYNWDNYQIKDRAAASTIVNIVTDNVYASLRKSVNGKYLRFLTKTHTVSEIQTNNRSPKGGDEGGGIKGSVIGKLFGMK